MDEPKSRSNEKGGADATVNSRTHCLILVDRFRGARTRSHSDQFSRGARLERSFHVALGNGQITYSRHSS